MDETKTLQIDYDGHSLHFKEHNCYESRGKSTIALIKEAFDSLDDSFRSSLKPFSAFLFLGDKPNSPYAFCSRQYDDRTIPCHVFHQWKEVGIDDYDALCDEMLNRGSSPPKDQRLFWIGNANTHPTRKLLLEIAKTNPDIQAIDSGIWHGSTGEMKLPANTFISLPDHCDYKYLIDLQGFGYSGRTKILFHSNRPVFYQDRPWHEYWFFQIAPFVHYIPIKEDLSDLIEKIEWAKQHPKECNTIASNALQFAKMNLRRANAIKRYQDILLMLGR